MQGSERPASVFDNDESEGYLSSSRVVDLSQAKVRLVTNELPIN